MMLIARARTDKNKATSSLLMRFTPFLQFGQIEVAGCGVHVVWVAKDSFVFHVLERNFRRNLDVGADFQVNLMYGLGNSGIPETGYGFIAHNVSPFAKHLLDAVLHDIIAIRKGVQ